MAFVVEDGTGKTDATSYVTVAEFRSYWTDRGTTFSQTDEQLQPWLIIATQYADANYNFSGERANNDQALEWPRSDAFDKNCTEIASDSIPVSLKYAVCELAKASNGKALEIVVDTRYKSRRVGPASWTVNTDASTVGVHYSAADNWMNYIRKKPTLSVIRG
jgi:hypothetical protein